MQSLLHAEVRELSRGKVVSRDFELKNEIRIFFFSNFIEVTKYTTYYNNFKWLCRVAYLADIFNSLNSLNMSLQEIEDNIFRAEDDAMLKNFSYGENVHFKTILTTFQLFLRITF